MLFPSVLAYSSVAESPMPPRKKQPSLYGISRQNSSRTGGQLWGKNQFNSTFPLSLCLYMRDQGIEPVAVIHGDEGISAQSGEWEMEDVIGAERERPYYHFESGFNPYAVYSRNDTDKIDIVVAIDERHLRPLEVKLTVVPDKTTSKLTEDDWAPEMVMRPVSSAHAMMGVAKRLLEQGNSDLKQEAISVLRTAYNRIRSWENSPEILQHESSLADALAGILDLSRNIQSPFLVQPIWRTEGQSLKLKNQCFDVFVWSDLAVMAIPLYEHRKSKDEKVTRPLREIARHVRSLYDILQTGDYDYRGIYKGMAHDMQTDKSFALNGGKSMAYLGHERLQSPVLERSVLSVLIRDGGTGALKPERRFDAAVIAHMGI